MMYKKCMLLHRDFGAPINEIMQWHKNSIMTQYFSYIIAVTFIGCVTYKLYHIKLYGVHLSTGGSEMHVLLW